MRMPTLPLVIVEAEGLRRTIVLYDTTLPREGNETALTTKVRGKDTWYLGSKEATSQVLGPSYEPIRFAGLLEDKRTGVSGSAVALQWLIDLVGEAGRVVLFSYGPFVRRCRWLRHSFTLFSLQKIGYEIELQPIGNEVRDRKRVKQDVNAMPSVEKSLEFAAEVDGELVQLGGQSASAASGEMQKVLELTVESGEALQGVAQQGAMVDQGVASFALTKLDSARAALGNAVDHVRNLDWSSVTQGEFSALASWGLAVLNVHSGMASTAKELGSLRTSVASLAGEASEGEIYIAAEGDTLHSISTKFYGTPHRWSDIMRDNGKQTPAVAAGEQILLRGTPRRDQVTAP